MELKQKNHLDTTELDKVLIVPYGIETSIEPGELLVNDWVLIVPYGIETSNNDTLEKVRDVVLIVPYGIETL